ncbi:MAG: protein-disulfide isomerase [Burkholderiales bacterium 21-58-4]|nr:MAG: protein-disulfide isomerase [Burkholderiales bacterium 21-58-4]
MNVDQRPHLIYFADPMCSWCWGFSHVIAEIEKAFDVPIRLVLGGLRPGTSRPMSDEDKASIRAHWENVHDMTGQPFDWDFFGRSHFVYDTEPACRAVVVMRRQGKGLAAFHRIQKTFYVENLDVTSEPILAGIAVELGMEAERFLEAWHAVDAIDETRRDFSLTQGSGVTGFPTLVASGSKGHAYSVVTRGYQPPETVFQILESWRADQARLMKGKE